MVFVRTKQRSACSCLPANDAVTGRRPSGYGFRVIHSFFIHKRGVHNASEQDLSGVCCACHQICSAPQLLRTHNGTAIFGKMPSLQAAGPLLHINNLGQLLYPVQQQIALFDEGVVI